MPIYVQARDYPKPFTVQISQPNGRRRTARGRLHRLGAITPDQAAQTAMPTSQISSRAGFTQAVYNNIVAAAQSGNFETFNPSGCSLAPSGAAIKSAVTSSGAAIAGKVALMLPPPANVILAGVAAALNVFGALFAHHAQAVAKEQQVVCAAVPAASDALTAIEQAVAAGTVSPADGIAMLQNLLSSFKSQVSSIIKENSSQCNAACVWVKQLTAIVAELTSQYQDLAAQQAANPLAIATGASAGGVNWLPLAIAAAVGVFLLK